MHQFENLVKLDATVSGTNKSSFFATFGDYCSYFFSVTRCLYFDSLCFKVDLNSNVHTPSDQCPVCDFTHVEFLPFLKLFSEDSCDGSTTATTGHCSIISMDRHLSKLNLFLLLVSAASKMSRSQTPKAIQSNPLEKIC